MDTRYVCPRCYHTEVRKAGYIYTADVPTHCNGLMLAKQIPSQPTIVCLCGSTRFGEAFHEANLRETLAGKIVLSIGINTKNDADLLLAGEITQEDKARLDELHLRKIDLADEILVLNVGGYVGDSTRREIAYAREHGKKIRWLEPQERTSHE